MNLLVLIAVVFGFFLLMFLALGISTLFHRRVRPGACAHDPSEERSPDGTCSVCGGDPGKSDCKGECERHSAGKAREG